jgi:hypothetical protein
MAGTPVLLVLGELSIRVNVEQRDDRTRLSCMRCKLLVVQQLHATAPQDRQSPAATFRALITHELRCGENAGEGTNQLVPRSGRRGD